MLSCPDGPLLDLPVEPLGCQNDRNWVESGRAEVERSDGEGQRLKRRGERSG